MELHLLPDLGRKWHLQKALCLIRSSEKDFKGYKYELALVKDMYFTRQGSDEVKPGSIVIEMREGGNGYNNAIYAEIRVPGLNFQGEIVQFMNDRKSSKTLQKIW